MLVATTSTALLLQPLDNYCSATTTQRRCITCRLAVFEAAPWGLQVAFAVVTRVQQLRFRSGISLLPVRSILSPVRSCVTSYFFGVLPGGGLVLLVRTRALAPQALAHTSGEAERDVGQAANRQAAPAAGCAVPILAVQLPSSSSAQLRPDSTSPPGARPILPAEPEAPLRLTLAAHPVAAGRDDRPRGHAIADCRYRQH